jgi:hypothetical protein
MRLTRMTTRWLTFVAMVLVSWRGSLGQDHLEPERGILNTPDFGWDYSKRLREVLLKNAANHHLARMVCLPSFEPEWMVTVVREDGEDFDAPHTYYVEYVGAESKLFRTKDSDDIKVKRSRAALDPDTAEFLNMTWRRMLRRTRYPKEPRLGADGVGYHFSRSVPMIDRGGNDPLAGWEHGTIWSPDEDSRCGDLVAIGEALRDYALAKPEDRQKLGTAFRDKTTRLRVKLDGPRREE